MNRNLNIKIAYWYYILELTQDEIAKRLNFTRQKVNQIIKSLKEDDILHITIRGYEQENIALETALEEKYGLKECLVVSDYGEPTTSMYKVSNVAAQYLEEIIQNGDIIGVSWGRTLMLMVEQMEFQRKADCRVVSLMGALSVSPKNTKTDEIARNLANKLDCPSVMLYAPLVVENTETKACLMREKLIQQSFDFMKRCNVAVLGIGTLSEDALLYGKGVVSKQELEELRAQGFVGDIGTNVVKSDGSYEDDPLRKRIMSADIPCLQNIDNVIAVVSGKEKTEAIRAALLSGCINTLIIDETTAVRLK